MFQTGYVSGDSKMFSPCLQLGDVNQALRLLALVLNDTRRAQALCHKIGSKEAYLTLLKMLLHPPDGRPSKYLEACQVLASPGGNACSRDVALRLFVVFVAIAVGAFIRHTVSDDGARIFVVNAPDQLKGLESWCDTHLHGLKN